MHALAQHDFNQKYPLTSTSFCVNMELDWINTAEMALDFECDEKQEEKSIRFPVANLKYHHHVVYKRECEWMIDFFFKKNLCHRKWKIFCFLLGFSLSLSLFLPPILPICRKKPLYAKLFRKQERSNNNKNCLRHKNFRCCCFLSLSQRL